MADHAQPDSGTQAARGAKQARVFISYASHDKSVADTVCRGLEQAGISCWIAPRDVYPGESYAGAIVHAIDATQLTVLILSEQGAASQHVLREVERSSSKRHSLVALKIDSAPMPADFQYFLNTSQWLDATDMGVEAALPRLVNAIQHVIDSPNTLHDRISADQRAPVGKPTRRGLRSLMLALGALVVLGSAYVALEKSWRVKSTAADQGKSAIPSIAGDRSIAVLPFADLSEKKDQEYFADGLAEEVLTLLSTLPELKVISRTSSFQFKGHNTDLRTIGDQLGAAYLVEGSVRRYGERVRVTAELIGSQDGVQRWSDTFEESVGDVLRMQQTIATALARALQVEVGGAPWQAPTTLASTDAYTAYLHGLHAMDRFDAAGLDIAISFFERALVLDPMLIRAREKLAQVYYIQLELGLVTPNIGAKHLREALEAVLRDDPQSPMGHALRAELLETYDWNWGESQREAELAVSLSKNSSFALYAAADINGALGRWSESEALFRQALAIDPLDADTHALFGWTLFHAGNFTQAESEAHRVLEIRPSYTTEHFYLGMTLLALGKPEAARSEMQQEPNEPTRKIGLAIVLYALEKKPEAQLALKDAERVAGGEFAYEIAWAHAFRGETTAAFEWLDRAYDQKDANLEYLKGEWALKSIMQDPRYNAFLRKMNLPE